MTLEIQILGRLWVCRWEDTFIFSHYYSLPDKTRYTYLVVWHTWQQYLGFCENHHSRSPSYSSVHFHSLQLSCFESTGHWLRIPLAEHCEIQEAVTHHANKFLMLLLSGCTCSYDCCLYLMHDTDYATVQPSRFLHEIYPTKTNIDSTKQLANP